MASTLSHVPVDQITVDESHNPRQTFEQEGMDDLVASVRIYGIVQPLIVRPAGDDGYTLVAGERRLRAARTAGLTEVPVTVEDVAGDTAQNLALVENLLRRDLSALDEARAYERALSGGITRTALAEALSVSPNRVRDRLRLLALPADCQTAVDGGTVPLGAVRNLEAVTTASADLADDVLALTLHEGSESDPWMLTDHAGVDFVLTELSRSTEKWAHLVSVRSQYDTFTVEQWTLSRMLTGADQDVASALAERFERVRPGYQGVRMSTTVWVDAAVSYGAAIALDEIDVTWITDQALILDLLDRSLTEAEDAAKERAAKAKAEEAAATEDTAADPTAAEAREERRRQRAAEDEQREKLTVANHDFGRALSTRFRGRKITVDMARLLAVVLLHRGRHIADIAHAYRLVDPAYYDEEVRTLKSGETRVKRTYQDHGDVVDDIWRRLDKMRNADQILEFLVSLLIGATHANTEVLAQSQQRPYTVTHHMPWGDARSDSATQLVAKITGKLPVPTAGDQGKETS